MDFSLNFKGLVDIPAAAAYLADLVRIDSFDAQHYLDGAKGMDALYLMISLCRSGVAYVARAIAFMSAFGLKEAIEFHDSAGYRTFKDLAADKEVFPNNHVDKEWSKDDATKTPDEERGANLMLWSEGGADPIGVFHGAPAHLHVRPRHRCCSF